MDKGIVIVGNGITAINAIKAFREVDKDTSINLFGEEKYYPYNRIKLSKSLFDDLEEDTILLQKKEWYKENNVNLYLNEKVEKINIDIKEVILKSGQRFPYDKLLLANGARNQTPPIEGIDLEGVFSLRSLSDAHSIHSNIEDKDTIVNIGGGIQGLETAWILQNHGKQVIISELKNRLMPNQLDERASKILADAVNASGIKILSHTQVTKICGNTSVTNILTSTDENIECGMVVYSTGIKPNIEVVEDTPIKTNKGIVVDNYMQTSVENIYAAGDIAEFDGYVSGLWNIAISQGKTAGYNMAGKSSEYKKIVPVTTLNAFGLSLFSMGSIEQGNEVFTIQDEDSEKNTYRRIFIKDNKVVGAIVIGDTAKSPLLKTAIEKEMLLVAYELGNISIDELFDLLKKQKS